MKEEMNNLKKFKKDCFNAFMLEGAEFDGFFDIPIIGVDEIIVPTRLISYEKTNFIKLENGDFVHFYIDDYKFDGKNGIWNSIKTNTYGKKGFSFEKIERSTGVITPDYSLFLDMPLAMQIWNVYRSRAIGYYLRKNGYYVIPNIRWSDENSYDFAFSGIKKGTIVSVSTLGCYKKKEDKYLFNKGFIEMIKRLSPKFIIIYGSVSVELIGIMLANNIKWKQFDSDTSTYFKEARKWA